MSDAMGCLLDFEPEALLRPFRTSAPASVYGVIMMSAISRSNERSASLGLGQALKEVGNEPRSLHDAPVGTDWGLSFASHAVGELPLVRRPASMAVCISAWRSFGMFASKCIISAVGLPRSTSAVHSGVKSSAIRRASLSSRDGLAGHLAARLQLDDGSLRIVDAHADERGVLGTQATASLPSATSQRRARSR